MFSEHTGIFVLEGGGAPWITVEAACSSQNDGSGISAGVFASSGLFSMPFGPSFCGEALADDGLFLSFSGQQRSLSDCIDDFISSEVKEMKTGCSKSAGCAGRSRIAAKSGAWLDRAALF